MCNTISEGGKRCAVHMCGSRAAIKEAEIYTREDKGVLSKLFTLLRKEGKKLPAPSPEEVRDFVDGQRVRARFDSSLSTRDSNTLVRNWEKARDEQPDGGTFHAWKNLRNTAAMQKLRRGIAVFSIGTMATVSAACGAQPDPQPTPEPSPTATTQPAPEPAVPEGFTYKLPEGLAAGGVVSSQYGDYQPLTVAEGSPLVTYNQDIVSAEAQQYFSPEEITEAQSVASKFVAEQGMDSTLVYDYSNETSQQWWEDNKDSIHPQYQSVFHDNIVNLSTRSPIIDTNAGDMLTADGTQVPGEWVRGNPVYEPGTMRTGNVSLELTKVDSYDNGNFLTFEYDGSATRVVSDPTGDIKTNFTEDTTYDFEIVMMEHGGTWKLAGTNNTMSTVSNFPK